MKQYLVTAYDYTYEDSLQNRMNVRPHHLDGAKELKEKGNFILGGAMLNDEGKMIGSVMILQFETDEELEAWKTRVIEGSIALGRLGETSDIAHAVAFRASSAASYITGETLHVNGGMYMA